MFQPAPVPFLSAHLSSASRLSSDAGWPHRPEDWAFFLAVSRGLAILDGGVPVATTLVTPFGPVATLNMVLVAADRRGQGLGRRVVEAALELERPDEWRLIATEEGRPLYEKLGFAGAGEIRQHQGIVAPAIRAEPLTAAGADGLALATAEDLPRLVALDTAAGGHARQALLAAILETGSAHVLREAGEVTAFACLRPFGRGEVAGPVVAATADEARRLLSRILAERAGRFLRVDTDAATGLSPFLDSHGLRLVGGGLRMRKTRVPVAGHGPVKSFALAAQAFG